MIASVSMLLSADHHCLEMGLHLSRDVSRGACCMTVIRCGAFLHPVRATHGLPDGCLTRRDPISNQLQPRIISRCG